MRITIVMGFFLPVPALAGGATEKIWPRLGELMAAEGHALTIVSRRWRGLPDAEVCAGVRHVRLPGMSHTRSLPANLALDAWWGLRVLRALPPADVVVCNTVSLPVYLRRVRPRAGKVAVVLGRMPKGQNRFYGAADLLLATSAAVAEKAIAENPALARRVFRFPNPIDWPLHQAAAHQAENTAVTIGYVGRIHPEKGLETLLDAAVQLSSRADLPAWRVRLIGPISVAQGGGGEAYQQALQRRYTAALGGRLEFLAPEFDPARLAQRYGELDVFCYPSIAARGEGLSIAPIEAMAAGAVPIVSQLDCYRDLIVPGENGLQFDHTRPAAADSLATLIETLLRDAARRHGLARHAQATARRYDYAETARLLLGRFAELISTKPA